MSIFLPLVVLFHSSPLLSSSPTRRASPGEEGEEWGIRVKRLVTGRKTCDRSCPGFTVPFGHLSSRHPRSAHPFRSSVRRFLRHFVSLLTPFTRVAIPFPHALRRYAHSFGRLVGKRGLRREETEEQSGAGRKVNTRPKIQKIPVNIVK